MLTYSIVYVKFFCKYIYFNLLSNKFNYYTAEKNKKTSSTVKKFFIISNIKLTHFNIYIHLIKSYQVKLSSFQYQNLILIIFFSLNSRKRANISSRFIFHSSFLLLLYFKYSFSSIILYLKLEKTNYIIKRSNSSLN